MYDKLCAVVGALVTVGRWLNHETGGTPTPPTVPASITVYTAEGEERLRVRS